MEIFSTLKKNLINPTDFFRKLSENETKPFNAFITLLLSNSLLVFSILLGQLIFGSDLIYTTFDYQTNTFIIEQITTMKLFGYYIASNLLLLIFFEKLLFMLKLWLLQVVVMYIYLRLFKEKIEFSKLFEIFSWSSNLLILLSGITGIFLVVRFITPLHYHFIYYFIFLIFFVVLIPSYLIVGLGKITGLSIYKRCLMVFSFIIIFMILWSYNHAFIIVGNPV